jgi:hypothetical protein
MARPSSWVTSFSLPHDSLGVGERGFGQVVAQLHQLLGPTYQHAISTFNGCSRGPTHRSLTDIGGGYNLRGAGFPHHTHRRSRPTVIHYPHKGPARSQVIQAQHKPLAIKIKAPSRRVASMPLDLYRTYNCA